MWGVRYRLGLTELGSWNADSGPVLDAKRIRSLSGALDESEIFPCAFNAAEFHGLYAKGRPDRY